MSLFGFVKDIGRRVFNTDEDAADKIKEHIEKSNPGVEDLAVFYDMKGIVTLEGNCASQEAREKVILMAGNVKGVVDVYANKLTAPAPVARAAEETAPADLTQSDAGASAANVAEAAEAEGTQFYVIKSGDTLGKIAKEFYGNAMEYPRIFEANREVIEDANKIYPGQKIRIPAK